MKNLIFQPFRTSKETAQAGRCGLKSTQAQRALIVSPGDRLQKTPFNKQLSPDLLFSVAASTLILKLFDPCKRRFSRFAAMQEGDLRIARKAP